MFQDTRTIKKRLREAGLSVIRAYRGKRMLGNTLYVYLRWPVGLELSNVRDLHDTAREIIENFGLKPSIEFTRKSGGCGDEND